MSRAAVRAPGTGSRRPVRLLPGVVLGRVPELRVYMQGAVGVGPIAAERVHVAPSTGDVEQLDAPDVDRQRRVDEQVLADVAPDPASCAGRAAALRGPGLQAVGYWTGNFVNERS